jgi:sirohydrochlorin cobaltochelatase
VIPDDFADAALVLLGHGTTLNADSAAPVFQHAAELRRRGCFSGVYEAFWKQEPQITSVLATVQAPRIFIVPLFISEGYFSQEIIPPALGFPKESRREKVWVQFRGSQRWFYCRPVGSHPGMTRLLLGRARTIVQQFPFPRPPQPKDISLFIAGHGTEESEHSRRTIEDQVERIRALGLYANVQAVFLDEDPRIPAGFQLAVTRHIVIVPFFLSNGLHVREDIPVLLGEPRRVVQQRLQARKPTWRNPTEKHRKLIWYAPSVGTDPALADVILDLVREAAGKEERGA